MQKLSSRLQAVADFVEPGSRVADVGTDHAFLPIYLVQQGIAPSAVAMDVREGPLERAKEHIRLAGLEEKIRIRLSDGLKKLKPQEADAAVLAGMGGLLTIRILEQGLAQLPELKQLILEPQSDLMKVRRFLRECGWYIDKEELVAEDGKFYPVLHVVPQTDRSTDIRVEAIPGLKLGEEVLQSVSDRYGRHLLRQKHPVLHQYLIREKQVEQKIQRSLSDHTDGGKGLKRSMEVEQRLSEIEAVLDYFECSS